MISHHNSLLAPQPKIQKSEWTSFDLEQDYVGTAYPNPSTSPAIQSNHSVHEHETKLKVDLWHELTGKNGIHDLEKQMDIDNNLLLMMCVTKTLKEVLLYGEDVSSRRIAIHLLCFNVMNLVFLSAQLPALLHLMLLFIPNISVFVVDFSFTLIKRVIHLKRSLMVRSSH